MVVRGSCWSRLFFLGFASDSSRLSLQLLIDRMYSNDQRGMSMRREGDGKSKERPDQDCGGVNVIVMETFRCLMVVADNQKSFHMKSEGL